MNTKEKTVFVEYSSYNPGQHFITVIEIINHKRIIVGRIFRHYDPQTKNSKYIAVDSVGNQIFVDNHDLHDLKNQFKEHGKNLAENTMLAQKQNIRYRVPAITRINERREDIKNIRLKRSSQSIAKVVPNANHAKKLSEEQKDKVKDEANTVQYKENPQGKDYTAEIEPGKEVEESEDQKNNELKMDEVSEREDELSQIREQENDMEEEIER